MKEPGTCYNQIKENWKKRQLEISDTVVNLERDTKLASSTVGMDSQLNFYMTVYLHL